MDNILVAVDQKEDTATLIDVAERLSDRATLVNVVRVVYEGIADLQFGNVEAAKNLRKVILDSEIAKLKDWVSGVLSHGKFIAPQTVTIWNKHRWQGVLNVATAQGSDLILKGLDHAEKDLFRTPDDWRLLRHSEVPVFFFHKSWVSAPRVVVALDIFDIHHTELNHRILKEAYELTRRIEARLAVMTVFPRTQIWMESGLQSEQMLTKLKTDISSEACELIAEACRTVGIESYQVVISEGYVAEELARESQRFDVLVIGTKARRGASAWTVGNTCEKILHQVQTNILVVP